MLKIALLIILAVSLLPIALTISKNNDNVVSADLEHTQITTTTATSTATTTTTSNNNNNKINTISATVAIADVKVGKNNYQINYNISNAKFVSIVADKDAGTLVITIEPTKAGKLTIELPRKLIDYKIAGNKDGNYLVGINSYKIGNFKEISTTTTSRTLEINFGEGDRTIEIIGTQVTQANVTGGFSL